MRDKIPHQCLFVSFGVSAVDCVNKGKERLSSGFGTGGLWGSGFIAWGGGYRLTFSPGMAT